LLPEIRLLVHGLQLFAHLLNTGPAKDHSSKAPAEILAYQENVLNLP